MKIRKVVLFLITVITGFSCQHNVNKEQKTTETISTTVSEKMITARVFIKQGREADFIVAAQKMIENSNKEEGCLEYALYQDPYESTNFIFVERYKDQAAIDFHFGTSYFAEFGDIIADMTSRPTEIKILGITEEQ